MAIVHAWSLAVILAAVLVAAVAAPAYVCGVRLSRGDVVEAVCATAIGLIVLAEIMTAV